MDTDDDEAQVQRSSFRKASDTAGTADARDPLRAETLKNAPIYSMMRHEKFWPLAALLAFVVLTTPGCELILDIFQAGLWVGAIIVIVLILIVVWIVRKVTGGRTRGGTTGRTP